MKIMKKNKPVEVTIKDLGTHHELSIGKKMIGKVTELSENKYQAEHSRGILGIFKDQDSAHEEILRHWNLHN